MKRRILKQWKQLINAVSGNVAVTFAIALPALLALIGLTVDYATMSSQHTTLQGLADNAAVASARELKISGTDATQLAKVAKLYVNQKEHEFPTGLEVTSAINEKENSVTVKISHQWQPIFAHFLDSGVTPITASATAQLVGADNTCVIALKPKANKALHILENAKLTAENCAVYSNSTDAHSIWLDDNGSIKAGLICAGGGVKYKNPGLVSPPVTTDCPNTSDPLEGRVAPASNACAKNGKPTVISDEIKTVNPGTYCGGLKISGTSQVTFAPGIYVIKDGSFEVADNATIKGENVGFYFTGDKAGLKFEGKTTISLTAPKSGIMTSLLFFQDRTAKAGQLFEISSDDARTLLGTIYLPKGTLRISANSPVADKSAYTAIIAYMLDMAEGPELVLHSNYNQTDIPVPAGLKGGKIVLKQ